MALSIKLNVGDGLGFTEDTPSALTVDIAGNDISKTSTGLFVDDLSGDGGNTDSYADEWTMIESAAEGTGLPIPDINRGVVTLIHSMCAYQITGRGTGTSTAITVNTSAVKSIQDIIAEMNYPLNQAGDNKSVYHPLPSELFQLTDTPHGFIINYSGGTQAAEECNRYPDDSNKTLALFCVTGVEYAENGVFINKLRLVCLYSSLATYVAGMTYDNY